MSLLQPFTGGRAATPDDLARVADGYDTPLGRYLGARVDSGWFNSFLGQGVTRESLPASAFETLTEDPAEVQRVRQFRTTPTVSVPPPFRRTEQQMVERRLDARGISYLKEEEWKSSPYYRDMPFEPYMTEERAKAKAEIYDVNRHRDWVRQQRPDGVLTAVLGFGAEMVGGAPDPVNWVGFGGWAAKGATLLRTMGRGAVEVGAITAATEPLLVKNLAYWGDDMTFADAVLDVALGAATGGIFAGGARAVGMIGTARERQQGAALAEADKALADVAAMTERAVGFDPATAKAAPEAMARLNDTVEALALHRDMDSSAPTALPEAVREVDALLQRLAPGVERQFVPTLDPNPAVLARLSPEERARAVTRGRTIVSQDGRVLLQIASEAGGDLAYTARHEVIHALRNLGLLTPDEWAVLSRAAEDNGWAAKLDTPAIRGASPARRMEETIAEAFATWARGAFDADRLSPAHKEVVERLFGRLKEFLQGVLSALQGRPRADWERVFADIERGRVGRGGAEPPSPRRAATPEAPEVAALRETVEPAPDPLKDADVDADVAAYKEIEAAGAVREEDAKAFEEANAEMARKANIEKAYQQASVCLARAGA